MMLTKAVVANHPVWMSSILFAELRPSVFIPGRFATLFELTRYFRSLATFVTPDPNIMLRAARLRDVNWQRPQEPMSLGDAIQIASALWVKEALGVPDLEFLLIDERRIDEASGGLCHSTVRLQDYADNAHTDSDAKTARPALAQLDARAMACAASASAGGRDAAARSQIAEPRSACPTGSGSRPAARSDRRTSA